MADVDLKALEAEMGIDPETQKGVDESEANFWPCKNRAGKLLKLAPGPDVAASEDELLVERAFFTERMEIRNIRTLANTDDAGKEDGTYVAILSFAVIDPQSENNGKSLDLRIYLNPADKVRAARTISRIFKAIGKPVPKDSNGHENIVKALETLGKTKARMKVNIWQGWREKWDFKAKRVIAGDWEPFSPRPADFNKRSAFSKL